MNILEKLIAGVLARKTRWIAKAISIVENNEGIKNKLLADIFRYTGDALVIGITGSPGAGKSSLTDVLTKAIRKKGCPVGIIAVDPSSPFTGGALLGDRIRMQDLALDPDVYIRSMATRGSLGGLARATKEVVKILDASGFPVIIVETVGVGQSELDILTVADTTLVVLNPVSGDYVQTFKAGIMEAADIFVVNKSDLPGAEKTVTEVKGMLDLSNFETGWRPPVVATISLQDKGTEDLWAAIENHQAQQKSNGIGAARRRTKLRQEVLEIVEFELGVKLKQLIEENENLRTIVEKVMDREIDPYNAATKIIEEGFGPNLNLICE